MGDIRTTKGNEFYFLALLALLPVVIFCCIQKTGFYNCMVHGTVFTLVCVLIMSTCGT